MSTTSTESHAIVVADPMTGKDTLTPDHGAVDSNPATVARQFSLGSLEPTPQPDSHSKSRTKLLVGVLAGIVVALGTLAHSLLPNTTETTTLSINPPGKVSAPARPSAVSPTTQTVPQSRDGHDLSSPAATPEARPTVALPAQRPDGLSASAASAPPENSESAGVRASSSSNVTAVSALNRAGETSDILFLQRPGVNMRAEPSAKSRVLGTAPKGTRFSVMNRSGKWVYVDSGRFKGWMIARFLGPNAP